MADAGIPTARFTGEGDTVDMSRPLALDLGELRRRQAADPEAKHMWIVMVLYEAADPEASMDDFVASEDNFVGAIPPSCLLCSTPYTKDVRDARCEPRA